MDLVKSSDLPKELKQSLEKKFEGMEILYAGEETDIPPEVAAQIEEIERKNNRSLFEGRCIDCDVVMPGFEDAVNEDWTPHTHWTWFSDTNEDVVCWQCPKCDAVDKPERFRLG
jgi:hypothetical protein